MDDPDFREIAEEFAVRLGEQLAKMVDAVKESDYEILARLAHWLKGAGGTAGFNDFTGPAVRLEREASGQNLDRAAQIVSELQALADRISLEPDTDPGQAANEEVPS